MTPPGRSATRWALALLAALAYLPALSAGPGRMPADSKLYLYLDPGRFLRDAASTFDPLQFAGWVPHQHVAYLWPAGPWFWTFEQLGVPDWVAHRLWIGTILFAAGAGMRWCARHLRLGALAALIAAIVYQVSPYVLPYISRTSVMLLPWAGLPWIVAFTVRASRRATWGDPAAIALIVFTVGAVNATALAMIVPAPVLWLVHTAWTGTMAWRQALYVALRVAATTLPVCLWWIVMLAIQGRYGAAVLPYSEALADVSRTSTAPEVWRGLGYWLFYVRDPYAPTTTESLRYLVSTGSIAVSFAVPLVCLGGLVFTRWAHRRFAALTIAVGALLAVGVHPSSDRSPLMHLLTGGESGGLALALRSSTRALPVMNLGLALAAGASVAALAGRRLPRLSWPGDRVVAGLTAALVILNMPSLWTGAFVDPALARDASPPAAWRDAANLLDASGSDGRVLQLPGAEFGAFRWGYTVDQPLPGLTDKPLITRDLLPLGSPGAMDLLYALDDRLQDGVFEPASLAPVARWLGADRVLVTNDIAHDRFRTARPQIVSSDVAAAASIGEPAEFGRVMLDRVDVPLTDERSIGDPRATAPIVPLLVHEVENPGAIVRVRDTSIVVSGSGDGLVDLAAAGLVTGDELVRYSASLDGRELADALASGDGLLVTDSNRDRARHWRSSQDTTGFTESDQFGTALLRDVAGGARLPVFDDGSFDDDPAAATVTRQLGWVTATATSYGEPFAYLPEHRPFMAIDGNPATAWTTGEHSNPIGERIELTFNQRVTSLTISQPARGDDRRISQITITATDFVDPTDIAPLPVELNEASWDGTGQVIDLRRPVERGVVAITIDRVDGGIPGTRSVVTDVGFSEITTGLGPSYEYTRPPHDALRSLSDDTPLVLAFTRLRVDPMDHWRSDPEPILRREFDLPHAREFTATVEVRVDARASDASLASLFGWNAYASTRLTGSIANAGAAAIDGDVATSWITGFDAGLGAVLWLGEVSEPIDQISVRQPVAISSRVTSVAIRAGGEERIVALEPDATGTAVAAIDPPLPAGPAEIKIVAIDARTTIDRRFGDVRELPAAISEIVIAGLERSPTLAESVVSTECVPLLYVDGVPQLYRIRMRASDAIAGRPATAQPCGELSPLDAGTHHVDGFAIGLPIHIDRVVLDDGYQPAATTADTPSAEVLDDGRFTRTIRVTDCDGGCWLVFGEGHNRGWTATRSTGGSRGSLGAPAMVDGGFNGWWLEPSSAPITITVRWAPQVWLLVAFALSLTGVLLAAVLLVRDGRRLRLEDPVLGPVWPPPPALTGIAEPVAMRSAVWTGSALIVGSLAVIGPAWALAATVIAAALAVLRRRRAVELTGWVVVMAVAALVIVRERRASPPPTGGWPGVFESFHGFGMLAIVCIAVAALVADDARRSEPARPRVAESGHSDEAGGENAIE